MLGGVDGDGVLSLGAARTTGMLGGVAGGTTLGGALARGSAVIVNSRLAPRRGFRPRRPGSQGSAIGDSTARIDTVPLGTRAGDSAFYMRGGASGDILDLSTVHTTGMLGGVAGGTTSGNALAGGSAVFVGSLRAPRHGLRPRRPGSQVSAIGGGTGCIDAVQLESHAGGGALDTGSTFGAGQLDASAGGGAFGAGKLNALASGGAWYTRTFNATNIADGTGKSNVHASGGSFNTGKSNEHASGGSFNTGLAWTV